MALKKFSFWCFVLVLSAIMVGYESIAMGSGAIGALALAYDLWLL
jgi:hypothetical protein